MRLNVLHALSLVVLLAATLPATADDKLKVLIVDGQNNHNWKATTPVMKKSPRHRRIPSAE